MHGGGFIATSSHSHQNYTRLLSKDLKCIVFSIDYKKPPEDPYPKSFDDCWQAYNWIINYS